MIKDCPDDLASSELASTGSTGGLSSQTPLPSRERASVSEIDSNGNETSRNVPRRFLSAGLVVNLAIPIIQYLMNRYMKRKVTPSKGDQ